jgi:hypothetical protein
VQDMCSFVEEPQLVYVGFESFHFALLF